MFLIQGKEIASPISAEFQVRIQYPKIVLILMGDLLQIKIGQMGSSLVIFLNTSIAFDAINTGILLDQF